MTHREASTELNPNQRPSRGSELFSSSASRMNLGSGSDLLSFISSIEPLNGGNYSSWLRKVEIALALSDIDLALTSPCPTEPMDPVRKENETDEIFSARVRDHTPIRIQYDLERAKWDRSNRKCLMVIKSSIAEAIRGAIPECTTASEYLSKVESMFTGSSVAYASTLLNRLLTEKYTGGGIREHILRMCSMAYKLPMYITLKDEFLLYLIFASLTKEFEVFAVNYNSQPDKWSIGKVIAMCVQEEERLKVSHGDSFNYVKQNKKKRQKQEVDKDSCRWCKKKGHYQRDCPEFLKHLIRNGIPYEENPAKRRKTH